MNAQPSSKGYGSIGTMASTAGNTPSKSVKKSSQIGIEQTEISPLISHGTVSSTKETNNTKKSTSSFFSLPGFGKKDPSKVRKFF
ncbi:MAG: hypothetical protein ACOYK6_04305 [Chthoniobacterales bacterium]